MVERPPLASASRNIALLIIAFLVFLLLLASIGFWQEHVGAHVVYVASVTSTLHSALKSSIGLRNSANNCTNSTSGPAHEFTCASFEKEWTSEQLAACPDVQALLQVWESSFFLVKGGGFVPNLPPPPHMVNCGPVSEQQKALDSRFASWAEPPWVSGTDEDNAPLTRVVQRDIWLHQHPEDCGHPEVRFLVAEWATPVGYGLGSQLHLMTGALAVAIMTGRVLVLDDYWERANHDGCEGENRGKFDCYFLPVTSRDCAEIALSAKPREERYWADQWTAIASARDPNEKVVFMPSSAIIVRTFIETVPDLWGAPWVSGTESIEFEGAMVNENSRFSPLNWWRAQASRYLLRFPTAYTCTAVNRAYHDAFGVEAAARVTESMRFQAEHSPGKVGYAQYGELESELWGNQRYMPRPILSLHVRHGRGKAKEMTLVDLPAFMKQAERIRQHDPSVRSILLSTETIDVVEAAVEQEPWWRVYYTKEKRMREGDEEPWNTHEANREELDFALANILMAAEADYFVGTLGSNYDRLIDELRRTGGRLKAGYIALNYDQI